MHREAEQTHAEIAETLRASIAESIATLAGPGGRPLKFNASPFTRDGVVALGAGETATAAGAEVVVTREDPGLVLDNGLVRVVIDERGLLVELDSGRGLFTADRPGNLLQLHPDLPTEWDAWDLDDHYRQSVTDLDGPAKVEIIESGPDSVTVGVWRSFGASQVEQRITVRRGVPTVSIDTDVDWHEREQVLKLAFPFRIDAGESSAETQFGYVRRPTTTNTSWEQAKYEICAHRWLHVAENGYGVGLANATTYGHDVVRERDDEGPMTVVRQTLLRAPLFPDPETDQGRHSFSSVLVPGADIAQTVAVGYDLTFAPREVNGGVDVVPLVQAEGEGVLVETVKLADDGSGDVVVRLYESLGRRTPARVQAVFEHERVCPTDLLEQEQGSCQLTGDGDVTHVFRPFELLTLRYTRK